jgi:hypothetical protein
MIKQDDVVRRIPEDVTAALAALLSNRIRAHRDYEPPGEGIRDDGECRLFGVRADVLLDVLWSAGLLVPPVRSADAAARASLPPGAVETLAAVVGPLLRAHPDRLRRPRPWPGDEPSDRALWDTAGRAEILDALWNAGLLTIPGGAPLDGIPAGQVDQLRRVRAAWDQLAIARVCLDDLVRAGALSPDDPTAARVHAAADLLLPLANATPR